MTIRRCTAADREALRLHAELRRVLDGLWNEHRPPRTMTRDEIADQPPVLETLQIDPHRRTVHR